MPSLASSVPDLIAAFWRVYRESSRVDPAIATELAELALADSAAARALFLEVVEPLGDAFDLPEAQAFADLFGQAVQVACRHPRGEPVRSALLGLGLAPDAVAARGRRLIGTSSPPPLGAQRLAIVPSRVSLGSEVAITTTIMSAFLDHHPDARIVFVGAETARGLVKGNPRIGFRPLAYPRGGDLWSRFDLWMALRDVVRAETAGLESDQWLVLDPDSRMAQTGLLPLAPDANTRYFPSRTLTLSGRERLAELASAWAQMLTGSREPPRATIWLDEADRDWAADLRRRLAPHAPRWAVVNLGVGGNAAKGLGSAFEGRLLRALLDEGFGVLLSRGVSEAEVAATDELVARLAASGLDVASLAPDADDQGIGGPGGRRLVTWQLPVERMAALVEAADLSVTYDSSGQHVAAALGTPGVTIFVPAGGERHMRRWSAHGRGPTAIVRALPGAIDAVVPAVRAAIADLLLAPRPKH
jgi:ADP-heptose:LPS heptosyltransferase